MSTAGGGAGSGSVAVRGTSTRDVRAARKGGGAGGGGVAEGGARPSYVGADGGSIVEDAPVEELEIVYASEPPRERWWLHALLLAITVASMTVAGVAIAGHGFEWSTWSFASLRTGLSFSLPVAAILLAHESGHYFAARRYRVNASPPYFIPFWPDWNLLGTLGAFIRIRSPIFDRRTLFDVGIAGPLAGMAVALPVLVAGVALSTPAMIAGRPMADQIILWGGSPLYFGNSILMSLARELVGVRGTLLLNPVAVAGWVGLLVTSLNLLPLAQFDGGHILICDERARAAAHRDLCVALIIGTRRAVAGLVVVGRGRAGGWAGKARASRRARAGDPDRPEPDDARLVRDPHLHSDVRADADRGLVRGRCSLISSLRRYCLRICPLSNVTAFHSSAVRYRGDSGG